MNESLERIRVSIKGARPIIRFLLVAVTLSCSPVLVAEGFSPSSSPPPQQQQPIRRRTNYNYNLLSTCDGRFSPSSLAASEASAASATTSSDEVQNLRRNDDDEEEIPCFWKPKGMNSRWKQRLDLKDLEVGQKLEGYVVQDLVENTQTGPKLFFECGVGRTNNRRRKWYMVNAMMRLGRRGSKLSVAKKRAARYRKKDSVDLYVSRVQPECGRLEVCATLEEVETNYMDKNKQRKTMIPITSLKPNQEVQGTIVKLLPYGAMVDVGANRQGLLHINKIADLYGRYIDKEKGMIKAGIERNAKVRLSVFSLNKRRLELDFTDDVKQDAKEEQERFQKEKQRKKEAAKEAKKALAAGATTTAAAAAAATSTTTTTATDATAASISSTASSSSGGESQMSEDEMQMWAEYADYEDEGGDGYRNDDDDGDEGDDDNRDKYDDENDIEDALGLGFY